MGSGHFSSEGHQRAAYVRNIVTLDEKGAPVRASGMKTIVESPNCYDLRFVLEINDNIRYYEIASSAVASTYGVVTSEQKANSERCDTCIVS
ncbi:uncharacterized protein A4U43_C10F16730 [Asparagus officinalis]|uniref:Neprosin PEP catalytic domain-containing protein n=1 Tax=Asparagus officinalis TaxID=4686 RepID=A0A5P1E3A0_ASPOF|nr:uncharacterized protein A4U43_C10F16730 [Asparagus officinalis]